MKLTTKPAVLLTTMILGCILSLAGCATTGTQQSTKASTTMEAVVTDIKQAVTQIDVTAAALQDLVKPGQVDVKKAFEKYSEAVGKMDDLGRKLSGHADKMSAQGKEYFEEWQKQGNAYVNPQIQTLSEQRRADLSAVYVQISEASVGVKGAFRTYMSDIKEIQTYLSNDLRPKGVEAITPVAQKAISDGENLKQAASPILSALDRTRAELAPGGTK